MDYFSPEPQQLVHAVPGMGLKVPIWILGSSLYGAQVAAVTGLPYAFASHFAPQQLMQAIALYRSAFQPSPQLAKPYVMPGFNVFAADTDDEFSCRRRRRIISTRSAPPSTPSLIRC
jgi:alkanesulfonate monooxygenase SsuD/methylene tetrahydromethanopterin reductase-like flavin-dependent oxidoreductase (luciferase family)